MNDHPAPDELQAFCRGDLAAERVRGVVRHLLLGCAPCGLLLAPEIKVLFGFPLDEEEIQQAEGSYDDILDRVFAKASGRDRGARGRIAWIRETLAVPSPNLPTVKGEIPSGPHGFEALLDRCRAVRHDDPARMVDSARFATFLADRLDPRRYGVKRLADLRCRAWTEMANAYRVADRLREAQEALDTAAECYLAGTAHELLGARLLDIQASLDADRRRFPDTFESLDVVHAVHLRHGDSHLAGRALLKKGLFVGYNGAPEGAVALLEQGLSMIDAKRDPGLLAGAQHNLVLMLVECGRLEEAREWLRNDRFGDSGRVARLRVSWLEGRIEAGLGNLTRAEEIFAEVRLGLAEVGLPYKAAICSLELAAVHLRQERLSDGRLRALEAIEVFTKMNVEREVLATLIVLRDAFEQQVVTAALLEGVVSQLLHRERESAG